MLIGAGIALFLLIFAGGSSSDLIILHGEKHVKKVVEDKERKKLILAEYKSIKKLQKSYGKTTKKNTKQFAKLVSDYATSKAQFDDFFEKLAQEQQTANEQFFSYRLSIQDQLKQGEWDQIMNDIQKSISKDDKKSGKALEGFKKDLAKIKTKILAVFDEEDRKNKAASAIDEFISTAKDTGKKIIEFPPDEKELLQKKDTTKEQLEGMGNRIISDWLKLLNSSVDLQSKLKEVATEEEWKSVSKWINKL